MRIVICGGDNVQQQKYCKMFSALASKNAVEAEFTFFASGEAMLFDFEDKRKMDLLLIKVKLPDMSGIAAAKKLRELGCKGEVVFITAHMDAQEILSGYDVGALHFIIEDKTNESMVEEIFLRAKESMGLRAEKFIMFTSANEWINIPIGSIRYFETYKRIVSVHYGDKHFDFYCASFQTIEEQLAGMDFVRNHRSYLTALKEIRTLTFHTLTTKHDECLPVGRTYYQQVKQALLDYSDVQTII